MTGIVLTAPSRPGSALKAMRRLLRLWCDLWSERQDLAALDRALLDDLGIDRAAASREAARPFWSVPAGRLEAALGRD